MKPVARCLGMIVRLAEFPDVSLNVVKKTIGPSIFESHGLSSMLILLDAPSIIFDINQFADISSPASTHSSCAKPPRMCKV